jgi:hypothetical protein
VISSHLTASQPQCRPVIAQTRSNFDGRLSERW